MALVQGSDITTEAILERFQSTVVDPILSGAYHAGNIPMCRGYQCVPTSMLDHLSNVNTQADIGQEGDIVSAEVVLAGLIKLIRDLTRVGRFSFVIKMRHSESGANYLNDPQIMSLMNAAASAQAKAHQYDGRSTNDYNVWINEVQPALQNARNAQAAVDAAIAQWKETHKDDGDGGRSWTVEESSMSGKAIFTSQYARASFGAPGDKAGVQYGEIIRAANLNQLMANIYQHWYNYDRQQYNGNVVICHTSCHFNCHSNCHYNCHSACHGWTIIKNA